MAIVWRVVDRFRMYRTTVGLMSKHTKELYRAGCNHKQADRDARRFYVREYFNHRLKEPRFRLDHRMARAVRGSLQNAGGKRGRTWESLVGYTLDDLRQHLESKFTDGMTWGNMGKWHIDHIRPKSSFNYTSAEDADFRECWALDNLQPLWAHDNQVKWAHWPARETSHE